MFKLNQKGLIFIETIFLAMILSFTSMLVLDGLETTFKSSKASAIRMTAIHLANAKIAEFESGENLLDDNDLTYENFFGIKGKVEFIIIPQTDSVTVKWIVNGNENFFDGDNFETIKR